MEVIKNLTQAMGTATILGTERSVEWTNQHGMTGENGSLIIRDLRWSDAERILVALAMANNFSNAAWSELQPLKIWNTAEKAPPTEIAKEDPKPRKSSKAKKDEPTIEPPPSDDEIENVMPWAEPVPPSSEPTATNGSVQDTTEDEILEIPEEIRKATQMRIVLGWLQENGYKEENELIEAVEELAKLRDEKGAEMVPLLAKKPNLPDSVRRQLATMA